MDAGTEWVVVRKPEERIGLGSVVIGAEEGEGFWVGPVMMAGEIIEVVRYERSYVVMTGQYGSMYPTAQDHSER